MNDTINSALKVAAIATMIALSIFLVSKIGKSTSVIVDAHKGWKWRDDWNGKMPAVLNSPKHEDKKPTEDVKKDKPKGKVVVHNLEEGLELAKKYERKVLVFYHASWCTYCVKMEKESLDSGVLDKELSKYVLVKIDSDKNIDLVRKYKITSLPSLMFLETGKVHRGYLSKENLRNLIK